MRTVPLCIGSSVQYLPFRSAGQPKAKEEDLAQDAGHDVVLRYSSLSSMQLALCRLTLFGLKPPGLRGAIAFALALNIPTESRAYVCVLNPLLLRCFSQILTLVMCARP